MIPRDEITINKPKLDALIGKGAFGKVYDCSYKGENLVLKKISLIEAKESDYLEIFGEMRVLVKAEEDLNIRSIPRFFGAYKGRTKTGLLMEKMPGEALSHVYKSLNFKEKVQTALEIIKILNKIHKKKYIHRDIKPDNIMIDINKDTREILVSIVDFGLCKIAKNTITRTALPKGTPQYKSPEVFDEDNPTDECNIKISYKMDIWSFGATVSEIFSGIVPWSQRATSWTHIEALLIKKEEFPVPEQISDQKILKIVKNCTEIDPDQRPKGEEIEAELNNVLKGI